MCHFIYSTVVVGPHDLLSKFTHHNFTQCAQTKASSSELSTSAVSVFMRVVITE